jgi:hypothetical protein
MFSLLTRLVAFITHRFNLLCSRAIINHQDVFGLGSTMDTVGRDQL